LVHGLVRFEDLVRAFVPDQLYTFAVAAVPKTVTPRRDQMLTDPFLGRRHGPVKMM
jgi:hypothetical protein